MTFEDCRRRAQPRSDRTKPRFFFEFDHTRGGVFRTPTVDFSAADPAHWRGLWPADADVVAEGVEQKTPSGR